MLRCTARWGTKWQDKQHKKMDVCIELQYKCDGVVHCLGREDEAGCSQEATENCEDPEFWKCDKFYKQPEGDCGEKLMCTARDGKWAGNKICLEEKFKCDSYAQCLGAEDEEKCEEEYLLRGIFTPNDRHICKSPYLETNKTGITGKFFPMRAIRCDGVSQCPRGDDEDGCQPPPAARHAITCLAIVLTLITFFSTPILEAIFGNGAVEGEEWDAMPRANSDPAEEEEGEEEVNDCEILFNRLSLFVLF